MEDKDQRAKIRAYAKYSGLAMQIFFFLGIAYFIGSRLDRYLGWKTPYCTASTMLLAIFVYLYSIIKDTSSK